MITLEPPSTSHTSDDKSNVIFFPFNFIFSAFYVIKMHNIFSRDAYFHLFITLISIIPQRLLYKSIVNCLRPLQFIYLSNVLRR